MATPENTFISSVHKHLPKEIYHQKNHNQYIGGIADCWYSGARNDLWIEYKFVTAPKRPATVVDFDLSELQQNWLCERHAEGRNVGVIVGCKDGGVWFPGISWEALYTSEMFTALIRSRPALAEIIINRIS